MATATAVMDIEAVPAKKISRLRDLAEPGGQDVLRMAPGKIEVEPGFNGRMFDTQEMRDRIDILKISIAAGGVHTPLMVRYDAGKCVVVDGETRLRACMELIAEGVEVISVPVIQVPGNNEKERVLRSLTANTGRPFSQLESGTKFQRLISLGLTPEDIASRVCQTVRYVNDSLALFDAPQEVRALVAENKVSTGAAVAEVKKHGTASAQTLTAKVAKAKAAGITKPVMREKAVTENPYRPIILQLKKVLKADFSEMDKIGTDDEFVAVPTTLIRKLIAVAEA